MKIKEIIKENSNAQQAAKAIAMKRAGVKPKGKGVAEGSGGNWYIRVNGKILNDTKFKPMIFSSEDEARSYAMKLANKKRIPLSQIKLTKSWMDAPEQGVAEEQLNELDMFAPRTVYFKMADGNYIKADYRGSEGLTGHKANDNVTFTAMSWVPANVAKSLGLNKLLAKGSDPNWSGSQNAQTIVGTGNYGANGPFGQRSVDVVDFVNSEEDTVPSKLKTQVMQWVQKQGDHSKDNLDEACWEGYHKEGMKTMFGKEYPNCKKNKTESLETYINRGECPGCGGSMVAEEQLNEKQDACYHKVKSRYKVWPSAYASGALVQCRKKGAANWGNSNESINQEEYDRLDENLKKWFSDKWVRFGPDGKIRGDCARGDDSEGKPKCLPQSKAHSVGKKARASAAARKRREDPNADRSGKAINVNTNKKSNEGVSEGAPELLKQEMPLVRHIEQELAQHGYEKGTPEYDQMFKHTMSMYRKFGNVDAIKRGVAEGQNGEYDDEAGMAETNLHTIARAAKGLLDTIDDNENLPEWVQEKIAKVEGMMVTAWDYLKSQEEQGIDPRVGVAEARMKPTKVTGKEKVGAVDMLERALLKAKENGKKLDYDNIDRMMQLICGKYNLTGDKLHDDFVSKHDMTPDEWIKEEDSALEETYDNDDEFYEAYGVMEYNDTMINEGEYQGRKVTLNKPMQGDVKKFKVYTKNEKGNVVKVNFGQKGAKIKKNNPGRRKNFRARHNCDNPGPKTSAKYWSCRNW